MPTVYDTGLERNQANFQPLTPLSFLARAAEIYPDQTAIIHGTRRWSYAEFFARAKRLASALAERGIKRGDTVSVILPNVPAMLEAHYGVAMAGAVLNSINTRMDAAIIAFTLDHGEAKVLITDREFSKVVKNAIAMCDAKPLVIDYDDPEFTGPGERLGNLEYEDFLREGDPAFPWMMPHDEWDAIALNYTSGTTGDPKGVVYHHRGAYLLAMANVITCGMAKHPVYLWTLPMFHCNGWCFPWTLSVVAGTHVCLRSVRGAPIYHAIATHKVTHLCGALIVMSTLLDAPEQERKPLPHVVEFITAAAPPPESVLAAMKAAGFHVTHVYGLTETYGPASVNDWHREWDALPGAEQAAKKARQGVRYPVLEALDVLDRNHAAGPAQRRDIGRSNVSRQCGDEGLSEKRSFNRRSLCRRLVSFRRSRRHSSGRLYPAQGPLQGHHHLRRREYFLDRSRGRALQASGGTGGRRRRQTGR
jgi:fatty-acyl-CoA synthase